ncbi:NADH kinase-like isoform X2 [Physcomitrium patens]|uniref:NADH kinase n=1 Tax=Physcomitrium patens TaxID=3218 RepID=A0A7I4APQ3_PHYPA|nr:NADH kinase-like isoform X2 [Physcomitrium patens]|eukprot:XP_024394023.1 NADH kinase-like isoform X2 [Physcomitrella patens]
MSVMAVRMRRVLVLAKRSAYDMYVARHQDPSFTRFLSEPQVLSNSSHQHEYGSIQMVGNLQDRHRVHEHTVRLCKDVLSRRQAHIQFEMHLRDELQSPIRDIDLVITVGGDGTLLQASHYLDSSIPVLGVNSDPTQIDEVEENLGRFDANRSSGHLCGATAENFEQMLDDILNGTMEPAEVTRIATFIDGVKIDTPALNDILIAHPSPAAISRCSFSIEKQSTEELLIPVIHSRSSGLRISTATGSTAAMKSAGGTVMPLLSSKLQYMVREPNSPHPKYTSFLKGFVEDDHVLQVDWRSRKGIIYVDGSHLCYPISFGSKIGVSNCAPPLRIFWAQK